MSIREALAELARWRESRAMLVARLENMHSSGDKWLTIEAVFALMNDCDMRASIEPSAIAAQPAQALLSARAIAAEQAHDEALWFRATTITESYLQQELRRLTAAIEGNNS